MASILPCQSINRAFLFSRSCISKGVSMGNRVINYWFNSFCWIFGCFRMVEKKNNVHGKIDLLLKKSCIWRSFWMSRMSHIAGLPLRMDFSIL